MAEPVIGKAIAVLDFLSRDPETVRLAELRMKKILDERSMLEGAREEARLEGRKEGRKEGLKEGLKEGKIEGLREGNLEGKLEAATEMILDGEPIEKIVKYCKLSKDEVLKLSSKISH